MPHNTNNTMIEDALDDITEYCRDSFDYMPDLQRDLLIGYLAQIRMAIGVERPFDRDSFPSMSVNDWERQQRIASFGSIAEDPTYSEARCTAFMVKCPLCDVNADERCLTASGRSTTKPHQGRIYARMAALQPQTDDCPPHGIDRVSIDDVFVEAARDEMLAAAQLVRAERALHASLADVEPF